MSPPRALADSWIRVVRGLTDDGPRVCYVVDLLLRTPVVDLARALDVWCERAEQAEDGPRAALVALIDAVAVPAVAEVAQRLREEAAGESLFALERLLRQPLHGRRRVLEPDAPSEARAPDYGRGRPLTLGERKSLARRPDRVVLVRLLADPHPDVIERLLSNPRITEDDVLVLATKRPCRGDILRQVARSTRWAHRARIRRALVLNPSTPLELAIGFSGLLLRQELRLVVTSPEVHPAVRAVCQERLERLPPSLTADDDDASPLVH